MDRRTEQKRMPLPGYQVMGLCAGCAEKLAKIRPLEKVPDSGELLPCALCWRPAHGSRYRVYPRPRPKYRKGTGGGERERSAR